MIAVVASAGYILLAHLFGEGKGTVAGGFVGTFGAALRLSWPLRKQRWFWVTIVALAALHVIAVAMFPWDNAAGWNGATLMPFMWADVALIMGVVYLIYRYRYGVPAELFAEPERRYADDRDYPID